MIRSTGLLTAMESPQLEWNALDEPQSSLYGDCYFSASGGDAESQHVFIDGSRLAARFAEADGATFSIGELGFGSGLNFLLSWSLFEHSAPAGARLHYWSVDRYPLRRDALERALTRWPGLAPQRDELLNAYPPPVPGVHRRRFASGRVSVDFVWADISDALEELDALPQPGIDAWFLDGFAPSRNAAMWAPEVFRAIARSSKAGASVASYSAAGQVRRGLEAAGFTVSKRPGFGSKRECVAAVLEQAVPAAPPRSTPWDLAEGPALRPAQVLVIGAGLAGAHAAAALARRGFSVTVVEAGDPAAAASGNPQGVLFNRLSHQRSTLSDFSLFAFGFARTVYQQLFAEGRLRSNVDGDFAGCLQIDAPRGDPEALAEALQALPELARAVDVSEASALIGSRSQSGGIWQGDAGWLSPPAVCRALLTTPGITLKRRCGEIELQRQQNGLWSAVAADGAVLASAEVAILAAGVATRQFSQAAALPLRAVRGQTTQIPAPAGQQLQASLCHRGYITPAQAGIHCIGASFGPGDEDTQLRENEHVSNLSALAGALPDWAEALEALDPATLGGRAALRCVSPDYLPLAGPVPLHNAFLQRFAKLGEDAKQLIGAPGPCHPGLYVSVAHGSRGLSYAALAAELIASQIAGDLLPLSRELQRAVAPARFLIRDIIRGKAATTAVTGAAARQ